MDAQGERIVLTETEQLIADLPEAIPIEDALSTAHRVLEQAESCVGQSEELARSPVFGNRAQAAGLFRKALFLRRMGAELTEIGAPTFADSVEAFLEGRDS
jgi:hypothetical protein